MDTDAGLIVPVLRDVDKNLLQLSRELQDLTQKTRERKIGLEELQGGTFTISNQGSIGGSHFTPIIYAPQVKSSVLARDRISQLSSTER